ncbi:MFS general substrate transporter [Lichtheimia hyalospora FSU 10163]|nr:MFS general substrate transporter [Lichtheimia hyalospora FSU 10163]
MTLNKQIIHGKPFDEETGKNGVEIIQTERTIPPEEIPIDPEIERRLVRKLDLRLMIWAFLAYFANLLDRNNMRNLQIPGNMVITKVKPRFFLPSVVLLWGAVVSFMALITDYKSLWGMRLCLGVSEAAFYPGCMFLLGSWYTKTELGKRTMFFAIGNQISGALGGLIAGSIAQNLHGASGMAGWKWLFIIEGLIGIVVGIAGFILIPNYPHNTPWLSPEEAKVAQARLTRQGKQVRSMTYSWKTFSNLLMTPYAWLMVVNFACIYIGNNMSLNFAIILRDMGYSSSFANYMNTPAYLFGAIIALAIGWSSDHFRERPFHLAGVQLWVAIWFLILAVVNHGANPPVLLFIGTYALTANISMTPLCLAWCNEIYKSDTNTRALAIAFINAIGNLAPNFINIKAWVVSDSPDFWLGKITTMAMSFASVVLTIFIWYLTKIEFMLPRDIDNSHTNDNDNDDESVVRERRDNEEER